MKIPNPDLSPTRRAMLLGSALVAGNVTGAGGETRQGKSAEMVAHANNGTVGIITGGIDGTYIRIAADLASVLDDGDNLRILPIIGKGSVQNLIDIAFLRGVDLGIVQSDALAFVTQEGLLGGGERDINYIAKLYDEEVHILARREIATVQDLAGKPVNVDVLGSGTSMTARLIFNMLKISVEAQYNGQDVALQKLRSGDLAAIAFVTGKPARLFATIPAESGLHFLAVPSTAELIETYLPAQLEHENYPALIPADTSVPTAAVGAIMAVFGWPARSDRRARVDRFAAALHANLSELQKPPRHPKWRDVNLAAQAPGWVRYDGVKPMTPSPPVRVRRPLDHGHSVAAVLTDKANLR